MSTVLKVTQSGKLIEQDTVYDEIFECPNCKKEAVKITFMSHPCPRGSYYVDYECENCGETYSEAF